jgi:hypothetical protein
MGTFPRLHVVSPATIFPLTDGINPPIVGGYMTDQEKLLAEIDAFLGPRAMAESTFGRLAVNDGKFVRRLRAGADFRTRTMARVREFICEYKATERRESARLSRLVAAEAA